uniref:Uncharacterized protein n=1 Tax=Megaselia scalaris TaxID=36166 RepID=T1H2J5_MEGSC
MNSQNSSKSPFFTLVLKLFFFSYFFVFIYILSEK